MFILQYSFQLTSFPMLVKWWGCVTLFYGGVLMAGFRVAQQGYWHAAWFWPRYLRSKAIGPAQYVVSPDSHWPNSGKTNTNLNKPSYNEMCQRFSNRCALAGISINCLFVSLLFKTTNVRLTICQQFEEELAEQDRLYKHVYSYCSYLNNKKSCMYNNLNYVSINDASILW